MLFLFRPKRESKFILDSSDLTNEPTKKISPVTKSKFKQLQVTGQEAEIFFMNNYNTIPSFKNGVLEDARIFGDGYDFQIEVQNNFFLAEIKGLRSDYGSIRMTQNEFIKAKEYTKDYALVVVSNIGHIPKMSVLFHPTEKIAFIEKIMHTKQVSYHTTSLKWS